MLEELELSSAAVVSAVAAAEALQMGSFIGTVSYLIPRSAVDRSAVLTFEQIIKLKNDLQQNRSGRKINAENYFLLPLDLFSVRLMLEPRKPKSTERDLKQLCFFVA